MRHLQETVDDLPAHIIGMRGKYIGNEELIRAACDVIFGEKVICSRIASLVEAGADGDVERRVSPLCWVVRLKYSRKASSMASSESQCLETIAWSSRAALIVGSTGEC